MSTCSKSASVITAPGYARRESPDRYSAGGAGGVGGGPVNASDMGHARNRHRGDPDVGDRRGHYWRGGYRGPARAAGGRVVHLDGAGGHQGGGGDAGRGLGGDRAHAGRKRTARG